MLENVSSSFSKIILRHAYIEILRYLCFTLASDRCVPQLSIRFDFCKSPDALIWVSTYNNGGWRAKLRIYRTPDNMIRSNRQPA